MRPVSDKFLAAVSGPHQIATRVDLMLGGIVIESDVGIADGRVTLDRTAATLGRFTAKLIEPDRLPLGPTSLFTPFGYELAVWRGVTFADGTDPELVPLGVFPIQRSSVDGVTLLADLNAMDRSQTIRDAGFEDDYTVAAGTNYGTAIQTMLNARVAGLTYSFASTSYTTPLLTFTPDMDPWAEAQKMARNIGMELYFDGLGVCTMRPEPTTSGTSVLTIAEGDNGVLTAASKDLDRGPAYNRVIAYGVNASNTAVPRAVATDDDPTSPSYYYGPFGKKPRRYASPFITTNAQALSAAEAILASNIGVAASVDFGLVPNPALEAGDVALIVREALDVNELHLIDVLSIGLSAESGMTGRTRLVPAA